jgi:hypothetical protein
MFSLVRMGKCSALVGAEEATWVQSRGGVLVRRCHASA